MRALLAVVAFALVAAPAPASAAERQVTMQGNSFNPATTVALTGDTVRWTNNDFAAHNATFGVELNSWKTRDLAQGGTEASPPFPRGTFSYRCTIHPFMSGKVDVYDLYLGGPAFTLSYPKRATLTGLAQPGSTVMIHSVTSAGMGQHVATATAGGDGRFSASLPSVPGRYQATSGALLSPVVSVSVRARVTISARRSGSRVVVTVRTMPGQAGATVQLERRRTSSWARVASKRLGATSKTSFRLAGPSRPVKIRARLVRGVNGYAPATSATVTIR